MRSKLAEYAKLMRLHKPIGILLLLWPTWCALWLAARGMPSLKNWLIFTLGVVIMRSAGCVINDLIDRKFDGAVARTKDRPLATGVITPSQAWFLLAFLCSLALILVLFLNLAVFLWSCLALTITLLYPLTKRFFPLPQAILGFGWYVSIFMAFAAESHVTVIALWFYLGAAC